MSQETESKGKQAGWEQEDTEEPVGEGWAGFESGLCRISRVVTRLLRGLRAQEAAMIPNSQACTHVPRLRERKNTSA